MNPVDAAACFRLTKLAVDDLITKPARDKLLDRWPPEQTKIGTLLTCPWCFSVWVAAGIVAVRRLAPRVWTPVADLLAMSAITGLIFEKEG